MNQLSDLELVAQAMSSSERKPQTQTQTQTQSNGNGDTNQNIDQDRKHDKSQSDPNFIPNVNGNTQSRTGQTPSDLPNLQSLNLAIDPTTLTSLNSLMSLSDDQLERLDESQIEEIMKQLEIADDVADDLEGKLDRLLATLGAVEEDIVNDIDEKGDQQKEEEEGMENK
ncbi:hypothetical protein I203_108041 [Kwoniella mangroviensis CBS 8507]|uniref:hypothetical protein n=1 Tax=Kwoniella mangroviensis CBS 8507 TaxID=1296122 RepID=UPI00080D3EE5|nr:uncharacterized protein I203_04935 [Kwoniella mangroviensis CBS 8507]OCF65915.1 hypothetical protein I203_04935 [Kwoniella mangroviensis CBS 8507]